MDVFFYLSGERLQNIAAVYVGLPADFSRNPQIAGQRDKFLDIGSLNKDYNNPGIVFCYGHRITLLIERLRFFLNPFILITHNSDMNIDGRYESLLYSNKIVRWYAQNVMFDHPRLHLLPIGLANRMWPHGNIDCVARVASKRLEKSKNTYFYFTTSTNRDARNRCKSVLESKGLTFGQKTGFEAYLEDLASHKFAICPEGNGIDSHRIWECYYLGVIPIVLRSVFTERLSALLPCVVLDSWDDFSEDKILPRYELLRQILEDRTDLLTIEHYRKEITSLI